MSRTLGVLETIGMAVCIGYCLICWGADIGRFGNMHPGVRFDLLRPVGVVTTSVGLLLATISFKRRRRLAVVTLVACLLWMVWAILPRL
jgi:hypothetical protein